MDQAKERRRFDASLLSMTVDRTGRVPLHRQIAVRLRQAILSGRLGSGDRLPSTRSLARELAVSRNTVLTAFDQLRAEGYLTPRVGDGTRVRSQFADVNGSSPPGERTRPSALDTSPRRIRRVEASTDTPYALPSGGAFAPGVPALDAFPHDLWRRITGRVMRHEGNRLMRQVAPGGYEPLREAIAAHVRIARGVDCEPRQVVITGGAQQAFGLCCDVLLPRGDRVWFEDPGYPGAYGAFRYHGAGVVSVPVDKEGLRVARGVAMDETARLAYVTPAHQFPLGMPMSLPRRRELLAWAQRTGAWILEDDYDSEFRFEGSPLPALYGLDDSKRVIYVGTFSKTVFPSLRLGFAVLPEDLVSAFAQARAFRDHHSPVHSQAILAEFMEQGHFPRHVRAMRALYRERQERLLRLLDTTFGAALDTPGTNTGLHVTVYLPRGLDDRRVAAAAERRGIMALALSAFRHGAAGRPGLVLGFAGLSASAMEVGVRILQQAVDEVSSRRVKRSSGRHAGDARE